MFLFLLYCLKTSIQTTLLNYYSISYLGLILWMRLRSSFIAIRWWAELNDNGFRSFGPAIGIRQNHKPMVWNHMSEIFMHKTTLTLFNEFRIRSDATVELTFNHVCLHTKTKACIWSIWFTNIEEAFILCMELHRISTLSSCTVNDRNMHKYM